MISSADCHLRAVPRRLLACLTAVLLTIVGTAAAPAQQAADLQLVLAVDTSGSVSGTRFELQKQGYVAAFRHPQVRQAIRSGPLQAIAATMVQWTGPYLHVHVVPWMLLKDEASIDAFAAAIDAAPRQLFGGGTSISGAIDYGMTLFPAGPFKAERKVIDVSGDGRNNRGRPVTQARDEAVRGGIVINGLPILALEPYLDDYYRSYVIGGPGAFVIAAERYETFGEAIRKKLIVEIAGRSPLRNFRTGVQSSGVIPEAAKRLSGIQTPGEKVSNGRWTPGFGHPSRLLPTWALKHADLGQARDRWPAPE